MYLARFEGHHGEYVQAAALVASLPADATPRGEPHWDLIVRQLSAAAQIPRATVAHRITLEPAGGLLHTIALTAPLEYERDVREVIARLTRIEAIFGGALSLPQDQRERDRWFDDVGSLRLCPSSETFAVGSAPLACDVRVADVLDDLLIDARVGGYALVYQLHMRAAEVPPEWVRTARKSMLALRDVPGIPDALVERQEQLARGLGEASAFCEEFLCVDSPPAARSVESLLADRFRVDYGPLGFPASAFRFEQGAHHEVLAFGVHTHDIEPWAPVPLCGIAVSSTERDRLLSWAPSPRLRSLVTTTRTAAPANTGQEPPLSDSEVAGVPRPCDGVEPFAFVSYKRQDFARIAPILRLVEQSGVPVWYDRGIPGGAEWDEVIEDRVSRARFVMLFASNAAVASKYVRREVKFADALDVPILSVALEDTTLAQGLRMLLTQYQMLDARDRDFAARLRTAIMHLSSGAAAV
jgi:hypothetical protein